MWWWGGGRLGGGPATHGNFLFPKMSSPLVPKDHITAPLHYQGKVSKPASDGDLFGARGNDSFCSSGIVLAEKTILVREEIFD
jgi:hypothetical protein